MRLLRYFLSELWAQKRFTLLFVLNLSLGLAGFIALDAFRVSIDTTMKSRSKKILGADMGISARRPITEAEEQLAFQQLPKSAQQAVTTEFYSMVATDEDTPVTRLVKVKAVGEKYPFYGSVVFDSGKEKFGPFDELDDGYFVWIYKELTYQLGLKLGDPLRVGEKVFTIKGIITEDSTAGLGASFAPTVYISNNNVKETGLIVKGSVAWHSRLYRLDEYAVEDLKGFQGKIFESSKNQDLRVYTHVDASEQMSRLLQTLNDYLGLVAIVALLLASVGTGFLYRSFFSAKVQQVAILMTLGLTQARAALFYMWQLVLLGLLSSVLAIVLGISLVPFIQSLTQELLAIPFEFIIPQSTLWLAFALGVWGSFLIGLPFLAQIKELSASLLLKGGFAQASLSPLRFLTYSIPALVAVWGLAIWQAHSWVVGSSFMGALLVTGLILILVVVFSFRFLQAMADSSGSYPVKFALKDIAANRWTSASCFLAIGLGAVLINLIPQVRASLQQELQSPESSNLPSLFMFDIQEPQLYQLLGVAKNLDIKVTQVSPMIRARLIKVNDKGFDKGKGAGEGISREEQREMRFRNRGFNLSYRDGFDESESLYSGEYFDGAFEEGGAQEFPFISVEKRFADRLGLKLGDKMEFEIEGVPVVGIIKNLRSVRWTSFRPNFFIQFQLGVLEPAPKTFITTIESLPEKEKAKLQSEIVKVAPNVSMIDVTRLVERLTDIISQMSLALLAMAILCFFAGFVVIYSIAQHQAEQQRWQMGLLKVLGAPYGAVVKQFVIQFLVLSGMAALLGVVVSILMSYVISTLLFESLWVFEPMTPLLSFALIIVTTILVVIFASSRALRVKPRVLLQGS